MKNANGEGSIYPARKNGKPAGYRGAISYKDETGTTKRYVAYGRTRKIVKDKLQMARQRLDAGAPVRDATRTVAAWLAEWRTVSLPVSDRRESTQELYSGLCRKHLEVGTLGATPLDRLRPNDVEALILLLRSKGLSDSTIRTIYTVLRAGLDGAVRDGLLARNPASLAPRPSVQRREARHLSAGAVSAILTAAMPSRYYPALALIAATGLRKGEALGLSWERVDLDSGVLKVTATLGRTGRKLVISQPKTAKSRRVVPLSPAIVALLRRHRTVQKAERLRAGNQWTDTGLIFTTELGSAVDPNNLLRVIKAAAKTAGVDGVGIHTLRHSIAAGWLENGVHIKAVADLLGHSSIAVTGDVYGHVSDAAERSAVEGWTGTLGL